MLFYNNQNVNHSNASITCLMLKKTIPCNKLILNNTKMQVFSCGHSYLKRDSRDSQISFCFTVFQEKSSSRKAKRVRTVILHLFNHVDSFCRPWTKRMQYPILEKKKKRKRYQKLYSSTLVYNARPFSIAFITQL